jgi:hypothetical protein
VERAFFTTRDAGADEVKAGRGKLVGTPVGVGEVGVSTVDEDVARFEMRFQVRDHAVDRLARGHHRQDAPGPIEHRHEPLWTIGARDCRALAGPVDKGVDLRLVEVVADDREAFAFGVAREVPAHDAETDHSECVLHADTPDASGGCPTRNNISPALGTMRCAAPPSLDHSPKSSSRGSRKPRLSW